MIRKVIAAFGLLFLTGCSGEFKHQLDFNPAEPLRIAVLPFVAVDGSGKVIPEESRLLIDNLSLVFAKQAENPTQIVRRLVDAELKNSGLDVVSTALIDIDLPHHGFGKADGTIDVEKLYSVTPENLCTHYLNCDAVMYGKITKWDRSYYGLESVNTVAIDFRITSARTGKDIFTSHGEDYESRGITKIPTGFSSVVIEPIKGLDSDIIVTLARSVVRDMLKPLDRKARPEFLELAPPSIYASSDDASGTSLSRSKSLVVLLYGTEKQQASFAIGNSVTGIPMIEREPGHYYGEYVPLPGDSFSNEPVTVALADAFGRITSQSVAKPPLSLSR